MISKPQFELLMSKLADEYDPANPATGLRRLNVYGPGRIAAIYERFKNMSEPQFKALIMRAFETERLAPLAKDLGRIHEEMKLEEHIRFRREEQAAARKHETITQTGTPPELVGGKVAELFKVMGRQPPTKEGEGA